MSRIPNLNGHIILDHDSSIVSGAHEYDDQAPIGYVRMGELSILSSDVSALDHLAQAAGTAADRLRVIQPGRPSYDGAERDLYDAMRELHEHLRDEEIAVALRDLDPHGDLDEIRERADGLVRLSLDLRAACDLVDRESTVKASALAGGEP